MEGLGLEVLVIGLCLGGYKCSEASKAYYYQRPHIRAAYKQAKHKLEYLVGENVAYAVPIAILLARGRDARIKLSKNFYLQVGHDVVGLQMRFDY